MYRRGVMKDCRISYRGGSIFSSNRKAKNVKGCLSQSAQRHRENTESMGYPKTSKAFSHKAHKGTKKSIKNFGLPLKALGFRCSLCFCELERTVVSE
jgi:hypothetical protein